ncbi:hypothetical protein UI24_17045 [Mycobacteroides franklinii]|nr:hypothetical protein [Mycobacteroides franklinii]
MSEDSALGLIEDAVAEDLSLGGDAASAASYVWSKLKEDGYAVLELPEPDVSNASFNSRSTHEWGHPHGVTVVYEDGETDMVWWPNETEVTADSLRILAATCLAAADESEATLAAALQVETGDK